MRDIIQKKIYIGIIILFIFVIISQLFCMDDSQQKVSNKCTSVYALEGWDFFIVDSNNMYYVENHEKNLIQKFDENGFFQKAYYMGNVIIGMEIEGNRLHVLTKDRKEYVLLDNKIQKIGDNVKNDSKWDSFSNTSERMQYSIFYNKITKQTKYGKEEIWLKTPLFPLPSRWLFYGFYFLVMLLVIKWILGRKQLLNIEDEDVQFSVYQTCPDSKIHFSIKRIADLTIGIIGIVLCITAIICMLQQIYVLAMGLLLIGIPFIWIGIGNLILIQYIKRHTIYYITKQSLIIEKKYRRLFRQEILINDIIKLEIEKQTGNTASIKIITPYTINSDLARKYEECILYDLKNFLKLIEVIKSNSSHNIIVNL